MSITKLDDVQVFTIGTNTKVLRSRSWKKLRFEIEYALAKGTTANSYVIESDKIALFDPPGEKFKQIYLEKLQKIFDVTKINYVIVGHINPNRATTLKVLREIAPQITFVASKPGMINLKKILGDNNLPIIIMRGEDTLDLGKGHKLQFIPTPNPRYPDHLCTYDPQTEILYTDKLFGAHICGDKIFDEGWQVFLEDRRYYFECLMSPHTYQVKKALEKLSNFPARLYAPNHGPLVRYALIELTNAYRQGIQQQALQLISVALIYASAYGNTAAIAQAIAHGITKAGVRVESINCEFAAMEEIQAAIERSSGFIIGSPTLGGHIPTPVITALGIILSKANNNQLAGVFGSFGWSGEAIDLIEGKLKEAGYRLGFKPIRVKFTPNDIILQMCKETGTDFAQLLKKGKKIRTSIQPATSVEQAIGRVTGSLCLVTAKQGDISSAMLASWVSQASFTPPGLTISVAKERALESLMYSGNPFVLNILKESNHLGLMKHFLKPFKPGENRFTGIPLREARNGCMILEHALAYLECYVQSRMEIGDHWLVYAIINGGQILDFDGITAVHHRKSGTYY
ncbi:MAG TPA: flavin oxidoreductase [Richelia sp.]|jgi:flavorubredoxin/flavin reductase (DIM6/NTAB) family NADH-FMN oxidoreductase RutF|nr:flavin oxidoreductase [Richelia sp.]